MVTYKNLIVIDGIDGSGKETQSKLLYDYYKEKGFKVLLLSFPNYNSPSAYFIKKYLNNKYDNLHPYIASQLYALDRLDTINSLGNEYYDYIICDRYVESNAIYQCARILEKDMLKLFLPDSNKELSKDELINLIMNEILKQEYTYAKLPIPTHIIYLNILPNISKKLIEKRNNKKDIHENDNTLQNLCLTTANLLMTNKFAYYENTDRITIDCNNSINDLKSINEIHKLIIDEINNTRRRE